MASLSKSKGTQRNRKPNAKYLKDNVSGSQLPQHVEKKKVTVVCNQTGKQLTVQANRLSNEDGNISEADLQKPGNQLLLEENGGTFPVTLIVQSGSSQKFQKKTRKLDKDTDAESDEEESLKNGAKSHARKVRKIQDLDDEEDCMTISHDDVSCNTHDGLEEEESEEEDEEEFVKLKPSKKTEQTQQNKENIMLQAKTELANVPKKKSNILCENTTKNTTMSNTPTSDKVYDLLMEVLSRLSRIEKTLKRQTHSATAVKSEPDLDDLEKYMYNGTNLLKVIADDPTAYVRHLLDIMFTKDEQKKSLLYKSEKSSKPELDQEKVSLLFDCLERRFPKQYSASKIKASLNQKCRDAKPIVID